MSANPPDPADPGVDELGHSGVGPVLDGYRGRLRRMIELRMDPRLRGRFDASDVIQEAFVEVTRRLPDYRQDPGMPFFLWVRHITGERLLHLHRDHLQAQKRDQRREVRLEFGGAPEASSIVLASAIAASGMLSPSQDVARDEQMDRLVGALEQLKPEDREVLVLRHFEHLSNGEVACVLGLSEPGASLRYTRAAKRLREVLRQEFPDSEG